VRVPSDAKNLPEGIPPSRTKPSGREPELDFAASARIVAAPLHFQRRVDAEFTQSRQQHVADIVRRGRPAHVGTPGDDDSTRGVARHDHRKQRLQHQHDAAGGSDVETKRPAANRARLELDLRRARNEVANLRTAQRGDRAHRGDMLRREPRPGAPGPNVRHANSASSDRRQRDRGPEQLPAALAGGAVDFQHRSGERYAGRRALS
jgi:hypothetical protein